MRKFRLFAFLTMAGGVGGFLGSVVGGAFGGQGLFIGGFVGGPIACWAGAWLAGRLGWLPSAEVTGTGRGAAIGFLVAATIAVNTLQSPVGPALATLCVGIGGLVGGRLSYGRRPRDTHH